MSQAVLFEGQWSLVNFLKPFPGFEAVYQGKPSTTPIAFPGVLDHFAERKRPGYDPNLLAGLTVPLGARVTLWIPLALDGGDVYTNYQYQVLWRLRTIQDFIEGQSTGQISSIQSYSGFHVGIGPLGQPPDPNGPAPFFLPGAVQTVALPGVAPAAGAPQLTQLAGQLIQPASEAVWTPPLTPAGKTATWQQGIYPQAGDNQTGPSFMVVSFDAQGDELTILASRVPEGEEVPPWDFTSGEPGDIGFSATYGSDNGQANVSPYSAILVMVGTR